MSTPLNESIVEDSGPAWFGDLRLQAANEEMSK